MDSTDKVAYFRSLLDYPSVVVAYFERSEALQAALAELRGLGLQDGDIHVITAAAPIAAVVPPPAEGLWERLSTAMRSVLGRAPLPPVLVLAPDPVPNRSVVVVQSSRLPGVPVVQIMERHGASKVETRDAVHTATKQAYD